MPSRARRPFTSTGSTRRCRPSPGRSPRSACTSGSCNLAGVRLDRAGATLLFKLSAKGDSLRVTDLAEILGVDTPTVTRKVQQLERDGMVVRQTDPDDRRASRIRLTPAGRRTIERVRRARRAWLEQLLQGWDDDDLSALADLLSHFARRPRARPGRRP